MAKEAKVEVTRKRPERRSRAGGPRNILTVTGKDPNYVYRWVNDTPGRVQWLKDIGCEVVTDEVQVGDVTVDSGSQVGSVVTKHVGGGLRAVLMRIPVEWYNEDQEAKQAEIDAVETSMRAEARDGYTGRLDITRNKR